MTAFDDLDRRFAQFLEEGPVRSPDRPVDAAVAHAAAHPRRRDPVAPLRRDPMAAPSRWLGRPVLVLAALGLLLVLSLGALYVGSRPPAVAPLPSEPIPSQAPPTPSPTPDATPGRFTIQIVDGLGRPKQVTVIDESGQVVDGFPWEGDPNGPASEVQVDQLPADEGGGMDGVIVRWAGLPCTDDIVVTIDQSGRGVRVELPACDGDTLPVDYGVWIQFAEPAPADEFSAEVATVAGRP